MILSMTNSLCVKQGGKCVFVRIGTNKFCELMMWHIYPFIGCGRCYPLKLHKFRVGTVQIVFMETVFTSCIFFTQNQMFVFSL